MSTRRLAEKIRERRTAVDRWLASYDHLRMPPLCSVDLRDGGFKIAPIDTNLFPSGTNNLCNQFYQEAITAVRAYLKRWHPEAKTILIWPEEHTRNLYYLQNVRQLQGMLEAADCGVVVANEGTGFRESPHEVRLPAGHGLILERAVRRGRRIAVRDTIPDLVWLNNDLTTGIPHLLAGIEQPVIPNPQLGWWRRRKGNHLLHYQKLAGELAEILGEDAWTFTLKTRLEKRVALDDRKSLARAAETVADVLAEIRREYERRGIAEEPFVYLKPNAGTYGLGMIYVTSADELLQLNRRQRKKLTGAKGGTIPTEWLIQEGLPTEDRYGDWPMEPVLTLVGGRFVGGFFRYNERKDRRGNLNSRGMSFSCLCFHRIDEEHPPRQVVVAGKEDLFKVAEVLARMAAIAAALEDKDYSA